MTEQTPKAEDDGSWFRELAELIGDVRVRFWVCPVREHRDRDTVTVEWVDGIAHCTAPGCANTSAPARSRLSEFTEETSKLADSAAATAELALPKLAELIGGAPSTPDTSAPVPVPSGVDDLRAKLAAELDAIGVDDEYHREWFLSYAMGHIEKEMARRDAETERLKQCVIGENRAGQINIKTLLGLTEDRARLSTALRDMARRATWFRSRLRDCGYVICRDCDGRGGSGESPCAGCGGYWIVDDPHYQDTGRSPLTELRAERDRLVAEVRDYHLFEAKIRASLACLDEKLPVVAEVPERGDGGQ